MYLVLLLVKRFRVEGDKNRFQKGVEKDLIALSEESIPVNTSKKRCGPTLCMRNGRSGGRMHLIQEWISQHSETYS